MKSPCPVVRKGSRWAVQLLLCCFANYVLSARMHDTSQLAKPMGLQSCHYPGPKVTQVF